MATIATDQVHKPLRDRAQITLDGTGYGQVTIGGLDLSSIVVSGTIEFGVNRLATLTLELHLREGVELDAEVVEIVRRMEPPDGR